MMMMTDDGGIVYDQLCKRLTEDDPSLCEVSVSDGVDSVLVEALANNSVVTSLSIENAVGLGDEIASAVSSMSGLSKLYLRNVGLSAGGARKLAGSSAWSQLRLLDLRDNPKKLGPRGIQPIVDKLSLAKDLQELNLSNCRMGHFGAKAIGSVNLPSSLKTLDLSHNGIGNDGAWKLAPVLDSLVNLESLLLSKNQIGDDGASEIGHHLPSNLKLLVMRGNDIGDVGADAIAAAVANSKIAELMLANNNIGSAGAIALAQVVAQSSCLQELDLNENEVGDDGAAALAKSLMVPSDDDKEESKASSLTILRLKDNQIGDAGAGAFVEHLDQNRKLTVLDLVGNDGISAARYTILDMIMKHRTPRRSSVGGGGVLTPPTSPLRNDKSNDTILTEGRQALDRSTSHPVEVSFSYLELCTENFDLVEVVSYGEFGELFEANDCGTRYLVRRIVFGSTGDNKDARDRALDELRVRCVILHSRVLMNARVVSLPRSLTQVLKRHDNFLSLKAYSRDATIDCLVYDCDEMSSLDRCIASNEKRKEMTWKIRLQILCGITNALDFLHNGGRRSRFHGDVKSANVFLTCDYNAQLIDCGVAQLVAADKARFRNGDVVFGSRGYRCPRYERGSRKYTPESDVFSLGIVMAELCTGCLQNNTDEATGERHDFYYDYIVDKKRELQKDSDELAGQFDDKALATVCKIALSCMASEPVRRPGTSSIVRLVDSILKR